MTSWNSKFAGQLQAA